MSTLPPLIFVLDDELAIAQTAAMFLRRAGYRVFSASTSAEVLAAWSSEVSLLLTDCIMPDQLGDQLAVELSKTNPMLQTVFMSGNSIDSLSSDIALIDGVNFIQKPFSGEKLIEIVQQALRRRSSSQG